MNSFTMGAFEEQTTSSEETLVRDSRAEMRPSEIVDQRLAGILGGSVSLFSGVVRGPRSDRRAAL